MAQRKRRRLRPQFVLFCILLALTLINVVLFATRVFRDHFGGSEAEGVKTPDYVTIDFLPQNRWSRSGHELSEINGVVIHYVGNPNTSAEANRNYFASLSSGKEETFASAHFIVGLEGEVIQCVPLTEIAYASMDRNADTVSIEVCHPDETGAFSPVTYERLVELTAWLCHTFDLDPEEEVLRHYDVTGKLCPLYYVEYSEAWDTFRADAAEKMTALSELEAVEKIS